MNKAQGFATLAVAAMVGHSAIQCNKAKNVEPQRINTEVLAKDTLKAKRIEDTIKIDSLAHKAQFEASQILRDSTKTVRKIIK